uniref:Uncharacterized protein n=1 Tax=Anguilla anguilla TaxID=7936 RepID=A0A0E9VR19_ANGAN
MCCYCIKTKTFYLLLLMLCREIFIDIPNQDRCLAFVLFCISVTGMCLC